MRTSLRVAAAQPVVTAGDLAATVAAHVSAIEAARADLVVFPELSLTGYLLHAPVIDADDPTLVPLVRACGAAGTVALVGAPVIEKGRRYIALLRVDAAGVATAYRKTHLGDVEAATHAAGPGPVVIDVAGWRVGLAICKDAGVDAHTDALAALGIDLYACGVVHHAEEVDEQECRAEVIASACGASVVMASFAGSTGEGYRQCAGRSVIRSGDKVIRAGVEPGDLAVTTLRPVRRAGPLDWQVEHEGRGRDGQRNPGRRTG